MNLDELGRPSFWKRHADEGGLGVTIVLPSGRAMESPNGHIALATDGLNVAEIALALKALADRAGVAAHITTMLDIDFLEDDHTRAEPCDNNLVVIGSAGVNAVASLLLDRTMSFVELGGGFMEPYKEPVILTVARRRYSYTNGANMGILALYRNPFTRHEHERVALLAAGILAVGTVAATRCLVHYLTGQGYGNNLTDPSRAVKIVEGAPRKYTVPVHSIEECVPPVHVANITEARIEE